MSVYYLFLRYIPLISDPNLVEDSVQIDQEFLSSWLPRAITSCPDH